MAIESTQAASELKRSNPDPHKLISLLMAGTLERITQAKASVELGNDEEKYLLVQKIIAIINGLRESLNFDQGGEIAVNLDRLYSYMIERIYSAETKEDERAVLIEVESLMLEVKSGWDEAESSLAA